MELKQILQVVSPLRLAFTGAGGKTTVLFSLAHQIKDRVFVSTTTHLAESQAELADHHIVLRTEADLPAPDDPRLSGVVFFSGGLVEPGRLAGPENALMLAVVNLAENLGAAVLLESDGSRQLPLKAPAGHEPNVPDWVNVVVVVAGFSGLYKPLSAQHVHRAEIFEALSGLQKGDLVTPVALTRVLLHPKGGLKGIPEHAHRFVLLNQADQPLQQGTACRMAGDLLSSYEAVFIAGKNRTLDSPQISPEEGNTWQVFAAHRRVGGVILAAGASARFGSLKQLFEWQGEPMVRWATKTALAAGLDPVVVVTGAHHEQVAAAVIDLPVVVLNNPRWETGQSSSVQAGLAAMPKQVSGCIFLLADMPQVNEFLIRSLVSVYTQTDRAVIAPLVDGQRANPVLFDRQTFPALRALVGDTGGRAIFSRYSPEYLPWLDTSLLIDIDKPADLAKLEN
jgi:molybdenum cofactor cytidylyltransferase